MNTHTLVIKAGIISGLAGSLFALTPRSSIAAPPPQTTQADDNAPSVSIQPLSADDQHKVRDILRAKIAELKEQDIRMADALDIKITQLRAEDRIRDLGITPVGLAPDKQAEVTTLCRQKIGDFRKTESDAILAQTSTEEMTLAQELEARRLVHERVLEMKDTDAQAVATLKQTASQAALTPTGVTGGIPEYMRPKTRDQRLNDLLEQYNTGKITAQEYYQRRSEMDAMPAKP